MPTFKKPWVVPGTVKEALGKDLLEGPPAFASLPRKMRNKRIFEEESKELHNLISDVQKLMFNWTMGNALFRGTNMNEFIMEWDKLMA